MPDYLGAKILDLKGVPCTVYAVTHDQAHHPIFHVVYEDGTVGAILGSAVERARKNGKIKYVGLPVAKKAMPKNKTLVVTRMYPHWKVHTPNLLKEVLENPQAQILSVPLNILGKILAEVGDRAAQLHDPILDELMCRLTIYSVADPESSDYDTKMLKAVEAKAEKARQAL